MLNYLKIKNLALIANAEVEFAPGFNVVTGESGSGKTVLLNTIGLLTGKRADKNLLRSGCSRCELAAEITLDALRNPQIVEELENAGIEFENSQQIILHLRRTFTASGNRNFLNDTPVTNATLRKIGDLLVDVHGANEHHTLLNRTRQLELLDRFGGVKVKRDEYQQKYAALKALKNECAELLAQLPSAEEAEILRSTVEEISAVDPQANEDEELAVRHKLAANAHEILQILRNAVQALSENDNSLLDALSLIYRDLEQLQRLGSDDCGKFLTDLELIRESVSSLASGLENYGSSIELDEGAFAELEQRLSALYTLKRHYGPSLENVLERWHNAEKRLQLFNDFAKLQQECEARIIQAEQDLLTCGKVLSEQRKLAAGKLSELVSEKLKILGFGYNVFRIDFTEHAPENSGLDSVDMMFSANPGLTPSPLRLIASSGEIARVMLALKAVLADADAVPVLIFDEIDVNIGGETGLRVGEELAALSQHRQLLCISHLPQVAALGEHHYAVSKHIENDEVFGAITLLDNAGRISEIGRMLGGTAAALQHAKALLKNKK
ncbi:MAG: DNA repair protein RecN [Lentisphaerae bacterium]|nr:DNA repair protein RecN [Lentisphaerota bacterium]